MHTHIDKFRGYYGNYERFGIKNLFIFVGCIIQGKTVNLYNLRDEVGKISKKYQSRSESHYKRLTRFLTHYCSGDLWSSVLKYGLDLLNKDAILCYLDATEWAIGKFKLHVLVLAIDYNGVAIPIYFKVYNHKGVLSEEERVSFLKSATSFCKLINSTIIADREFIGDKYFHCFDGLSINFVSRLRKGQYKANLIGNRSYDQLQKRALKKGKSSSLIIVNDLKYRLWVVKNATNDPSEPLVFILTNTLNKTNIPNLYRLRWKIETLFKHLKTNGYNLEDLRVTNLDKIRLIISMIVLVYILSVLTALEERRKKTVKKKIYHDGRKFDTISIFKQGQSILKQSFISLDRLLDIIQFIGSTLKAKLPYDKLNVQ